MFYINYRGRSVVVVPAYEVEGFDFIDICKVYGYRYNLYQAPYTGNIYAVAVW